MASTGRRMKMSVKFMRRAAYRSTGTRRCVGASACTVLSIRRRAVVQLDLAGGDDRVAFLDALEHGDLVAARRRRW